MELIKGWWKKTTSTKALENCSGESGKLQMLFFESVYRVVYITGHSSSEDNFIYRIYSYYVKILIGFLICGELYFFTQPHSMDEVVAAINASLIQFLSLYRYKNMMDNKTIYTRLATSMESPNFDISTPRRKQLVEIYSKENRKYLKLLLAIGNSALAAWIIYPLVDEVEYNLVVGMRLPFVYNTPSLYPLTYSLVAVAFVQIAHFVMVTDVILQAHLIHLLCQFSVLADCFENILVDCREGFEGKTDVVRYFVAHILQGSLTDEDQIWYRDGLYPGITHMLLFICDVHKDYLVYDRYFSERFKRRLGNLVEQHKLVLSNTMNLRNTLSRPMLGQLASSSTLICFIGYQIITTITDNYAQGIMSLLYLGYNMFELYIICRWCEEITVKSQQIGQAIYFSGWETGVSTLPEVGSTVKLVIARARKPLVFTAGGMYQLSLSSFATLVKTSYSALTVLLRFRH